MTITATHTGHDTTTEGVLFVAFELSEKTPFPAFLDRPSRGPQPQEIAETQPYPILSHMSIPSIAALRLAASRGVKSAFICSILSQCGGRTTWQSLGSIRPGSMGKQSPKRSE